MKDVKRNRGKKNKLEEEHKPRGFDRGLDIHSIVGATDTTGELMFLLKWQDCAEFDLLPASEVSSRHPEKVIAYYEARSPLLRKIKAKHNLVKDTVRISTEAGKEEISSVTKTDETPNIIISKKECTPEVEEMQENTSGDALSQENLEQTPEESSQSPQIHENFNIEHPQNETTSISTNPQPEDDEPDQILFGADFV